MDNPGFVRHGMLRLPPGFRFHPTDEELVVQYLKRKVYSFPLPAYIIPEIDLRIHDPWDLPGGREEVRYFFSFREATYPSRNRSNPGARSGCWKAAGKETQVVASRCNQVVGMKKVLVFYRGKPPTRTDWIMHEYRLTRPEANPRNDAAHSCMVRNGDWVLCRVFRKKRPAKMEAEEDDEQAGEQMMRMGDDGSSCVTELPDVSGDGEEASSSSMSSTP
ncbi:ANAC083 transcription factor [Musa troglodytarum]|uniref:ANAC083 transcription factor n=1 Tax=Musa troglodytarum TaxID=320322 RepID=A0A9E7I1L1_9LILI|nr:ANAC083 transcription factor [Musa troglodytarum]